MPFSEAVMMVRRDGGLVIVVRSAQWRGGWSMLRVVSREDSCEPQMMRYARDARYAVAIML